MSGAVTDGRPVRWPFAKERVGSACPVCGLRLTTLADRSRGTRRVNYYTHVKTHAELGVREASLMADGMLSTETPE